MQFTFPRGLTRLAIVALLAIGSGAILCPTAKQPVRETPSGECPNPSVPH